MDPQEPPSIDDLDFDEIIEPSTQELRDAGYEEQETFTEKFTEAKNKSWSAFFGELKDFDWVLVAGFMVFLFVAIRKSTQWIYKELGTKEISQGFNKFLTVFGLNLVKCEDCPNAPDTVREVVRTEIKKEAPPDTGSKETQGTQGAKSDIGQTIQITTTQTFDPMLYAPQILALLGSISIPAVREKVMPILKKLNQYIDKFLRAIFKIY